MERKFAVITKWGENIFGDYSRMEQYARSFPDAKKYRIRKNPLTSTGEEWQEIL